MPKTKIVGDTRGEGEKPATVSKNAVAENLAPDGISGDIKGGGDKSKAALLHNKLHPKSNNLALPKCSEGKKEVNGVL